MLASAAVPETLVKICYFGEFEKTVKVICMTAPLQLFKFKKMIFTS